MTLREAAQQALEALEHAGQTGDWIFAGSAIKALRAALAEPVQPAAINAELVEALRRCRDMVGHPDNVAFIDAALAKVEMSNG